MAPPEQPQFESLLQSITPIRPDPAEEFSIAELISRAPARDEAGYLFIWTRSRWLRSSRRVRQALLQLIQNRFLPSTITVIEGKAANPSVCSSLCTNRHSQCYFRIARNPREARDPLKSGSRNSRPTNIEQNRESAELAPGNSYRRRRRTARSHPPEPTKDWGWPQ